MTRVNRLLSKAILASAVLGLGSGTAFAACKDVNYDQLSSVGRSIVPGNGAAGGTPNGGLDFPMWVTVVDENSKIWHVVNTFGNGANTGSTWLLSRVISAQKPTRPMGLAPTTSRFQPRCCTAKSIQAGASMACNTAIRSMLPGPMAVVRTPSAPRMIR